MVYSENRVAENAFVDFLHSLFVKYETINLLLTSAKRVFKFFRQQRDVKECFIVKATFRICMLR